LFCIRSRSFFTIIWHIIAGNSNSADVNTPRDAEPRRGLLYGTIYINPKPVELIDSIHGSRIVTATCTQEYSTAAHAKRHSYISGMC
jgi:hypothetical protein